MLSVQNLSVRIGDKKVLENINLEIAPGEIHALMGPNGSGKTSLACAILGHPQYEISGEVRFDGSDITALETEERARLGIFLSFQEPPDVGGVGMENFLRTVSKYRHTDIPAHPDSLDSKTRVAAMKQNAKTLRAIKDTLPALGLSDTFLSRYLNDGFSGGEKKKSEMLQFLALRPRLAILDEVDSGLDLDSLSAAAEILRKAAEEGASLLLISHYTRFFEYLRPDAVHVLCDGRMLRRGDATLLGELDAAGYAGLAAETALA